MCKSNTITTEINCPECDGTGVEGIEACICCDGTGVVTGCSYCEGTAVDTIRVSAPIRWKGRLIVAVIVFEYCNDCQAKALIASDD